jgi:hypothetical protein
MIKKPDCHNRYHAAKDRFLKSSITSFFARELPRFFGPVMREKVADELVTIIDAVYPESNRLQPGQMLWNALDKSTRATSPNRRYVPVVLSAITAEDIAQLSQGTPMSHITRKSIARMIHEAYDQGGILSTRDIGLLTLRDPSTVSTIRLEYEKEHNCTLPHTGLLHDIGSGVSHKAVILRKIIHEKKDPADVARETSHSQRAVDRYLTDYHRVCSAYRHNPDIDYVHLVTNLSKHLIRQHLEVAKNENI